ncbi:MAG: sterol desaturase family protein, partial [Candidatus Methylumidiphilus sp.]
MLTQIHALLNSIAPVWQAFSPADLRAAAILALFAWLLTLEGRRGQRKIPAKTVRQSYFANLGTFLLNDTLMSLMSVSALLLLAEQVSGYGLLSAISDPLLKSALSFLLFDLALYGWHRLNHTYDGLWMFHKVHHSDPDMNVTTAFRLHFVEVVLTTVVKAAFVVLTGVEAAVLIANEAIITLFI